MSSSREKRRTTVCRLRLIPRVLLALFLPVAAVAQQSPDSARGDSGRLELHPSWDEREEYRTGARISDQLVARGEPVSVSRRPRARLVLLDSCAFVDHKRWWTTDSLWSYWTTCGSMPRPASSAAPPDSRTSIQTTLHPSKCCPRHRRCATARTPRTVF